jgi:hypothetical protein
MLDRERGLCRARLGCLQCWAQVITMATFHPIHCNIFAYSTSRGAPAVHGMAMRARSEGLPRAAFLCCMCERGCGGSACRRRVRQPHPSTIPRRGSGPSAPPAARVTRVCAGVIRLADMRRSALCNSHVQVCTEAVRAVASPRLASPRLGAAGIHLRADRWRLLRTAVCARSYMSRDSWTLRGRRWLAVEGHFAQVFQEPGDSSKRTFFSEIISSISDIKFSQDGRCCAGPKPACGAEIRPWGFCIHNTQ